MARLRNEEMSDVSVDLHDIFDVNPSKFPPSDYLNGKFLSIIGRFQFLANGHFEPHSNAFWFWVPSNFITKVLEPKTKKHTLMCDIHIHCILYRSKNFVQPMIMEISTCSMTIMDIF